jgi:iodotyrosine deiodinase
MSDYIPIPLPDRLIHPPEEMLERARGFYLAMRRRHTVRNFKPDAVPREIIEQCLLAAGTAPSGANQQPWHFSVVSDPLVKQKIRQAAETEERKFYAGRAGEEWLKALRPIGTDPNKSFLEIAPWLIVIWGRRQSPDENGRMRKNYYVPESVGIATGILITALHHAGLATLTHTPSPMSFLNEILQRPRTDKAYVLLVAGYPAEDAKIPVHATIKKPLAEITTFV